MANNNDDDLGFLSDDNENLSEGDGEGADLPPDNQENADLGTPSNLQRFIENDSNVPPEKRMTYILLLAHQNIPDFNLSSVNAPYLMFVNRPGWKVKFKFTKGMIAQEMKRRDPAAKPNFSNRTVEQMLAKLTPLDDQRDKQYVIEKEREYRDNLSLHVRQEEEEAAPTARISPSDRVRFALLFAIEEIYSLYLRSQDCLTRPQIDAGQSGAGTEFWEMALEYLNNPDWLPESEAAPTLHSEFAQRRTWAKGDYEWTVEKGKKYLNDVRRNLTEMIRKYEISGNGSNQAAQDDSDNEIDDSEDNWGRFNAERAKRVAERRMREEGVNDTSDGDDRANFLENLPVDYLHTWHVFDRHNLIRFTCAQLPRDQGASSHDTPSPTSATRNPRSNRNNNEQVAQTQREMVTTIQGIGASIADMSRANADMGRAAKIRRIDDLRKDRYRTALAMASASTDGEKDVHQTYMNELSEQITAAEEEVQKDDANAAANNNRDRANRGRSANNSGGNRDDEEAWAEYQRTRGRDHPNNHGLRL